MATRPQFDRFFGGTAAGISGCLVLLALSLVGLGAHNAGAAGVLGGLAYAVLMCWPAIPLLLLARRLLRRARQA